MYGVADKCMSGGVDLTVLLGSVNVWCGGQVYLWCDGFDCATW